jgi:hypothetical protein
MFRHWPVYPANSEALRFKRGKHMKVKFEKASDHKLEKELEIETLADLLALDPLVRVEISPIFYRDGKPLPQPGFRMERNGLVIRQQDDGSLRVTLYDDYLE